MPKRRKTVLKSLEDEVKKEVRRSTKQSLMDAFKEGHRELLPSQYSAMKRLMKERYGGVSIGYIRTLIFPEQYSYDIPMPLSSISYSKFTDKQDIKITPGADGSGMLVWYPRTNGGPQLFYLPGGQQMQMPANKIVTLPGPGESVIWDQNYREYQSPSGTWNRASPWQYGMVTAASNNFSQVALVGASISIQYIGRVDYEAGQITGGHVHGIPLDNMSTDEISNAQWYKSGRPGDGLRFVYLPKDSTDFQFYPTAVGMAYNQGANPIPMQIGGTVAGVMQLPLGDGTNTTQANAKVTMPMIGGMIDTVKPENTYRHKILDKTQLGADASITTLNYVKNASCIAIYFDAMDTSRGGPQFKIDIVRKFLGIPLSKTRDIVDLIRPSKQFDQDKTFNVVNQIAVNAPIGGQTLQEVEHTIDKLAQNIPNIVYALENGPLPKFDSLAAFGQYVADPQGVSENLVGQPGGAVERLYKMY